MRSAPLLLVSALLLAACAGPDSDRDAEADAVAALELPVGDPARMAAELELAEDRYREDPRDELAAIWYGRRLAYVGRIEEAIDLYTEALREHPQSARLLRHRGHRFISLRQFQRAEEDLRRAARLLDGRPDEIEPDGMPNAAGRPRSTTQGNIWYHLALAHFLQGEFEASADAWRQALELSTNDDTLVAVTHWYTMTLRRLGKEPEAAALLGDVTEDMEILENHAYHAVCLLRKDSARMEEVLAGDTQLQRETAGFGVAHWLLTNGDAEQSRELLRSLCSGPASNAFGRIAAEVELARLEAAAPGPSGPGSR